MNEGLEVEIRDTHLLVHHVPYLNFERQIKYGTLVSTLNLAGNKTTKPDTHVIFFIGEHPCHKDGSIIGQIQHSSSMQNLTNTITVNHSFSNKPPAGYLDYYEKITRYIEIISSPAKSIDHNVSEKTFNVILSDESDSIFNYFDTNSTRAEISTISLKLMNQKIAIIGVGGTGSYILDFVAKTPVKEIHLFDGDIFLQHNAFRAPGAPAIKNIQEKRKKTDHLKEIYSNMHKNITSHDIFISQSTISELAGMNFVFICIDKGEIKKIIIDYLDEHKIGFIDVGMGIHKVNDQLVGIVRVTSSTVNKNDHVKNRISFSDDGKDEYTKNIQIAELNALNAALAVIKWKKICGFYQDLEKENFITYSINVNQLLSEDPNT